MTREEVLKTIDGLATGENAEQVAGLRSEVDGLYSAIDAGAKLEEENKKKIEKLESSNRWFYMQMTGKQPEEQHEEEKPRGLDWDTIIKNATEEDK